MRQTRIIKPEYVITPNNNPLGINMKELWNCRELFFVFTWRDLKVRYKQTILGVLWAVFQPLASMVIFTVFFGNIIKISSGNLPYSIFVLIGLVFWNFFSNAMTHSSNTLLENENIIKKVYFPKVVLPLSPIITHSVDFLISIILLIIAIILFEIKPSPLVFLVLPICWLITAISAAGLGLFFSAINAKYRDIRYILPFFFQLFIFLTPVIYGTNIVSDLNKFILAFNPMTGVIETARVVISGSTSINYQLLIQSTFMSVVIFTIGLVVFNKVQQYFADIL